MTPPSRQDHDSPPRNAATFALLTVSLFLVVLPLTIAKPGLPQTFKADEPNYYLMALSLWNDADLRCEPKDLQRLFTEFTPPAPDLALMSRDGWHTVHFSMPLPFSLVAAPMTGVFGANGMTTLNMALLLAMVWMGFGYLRTHNPDTVAALYSTGFFLLSTGFIYVFWMHSEVFVMAMVTASFFFAYGPAIVPAVSGAALAVAVYHKPMLIALAVPLAFTIVRRSGRRRAVTWAVALALALTAIGATAKALTETVWPYTGASRDTFRITDTESLPMTPVDDAGDAVQPDERTWSMVLRRLVLPPPDVLAHTGYFLWGRHTGVLPYMPFAVVSVALFLLHRRRSRASWLLLGAIIAVGYLFMAAARGYWPGGGGFVGNRYFVTAYPAFLFLVEGIRPRWTLPLAWAAAGILLGPVLLTPLGAPMFATSVQQHARHPVIERFPFEHSLSYLLDGYRGASHQDVWLSGRSDVFLPNGDAIWVRGGARAEIWMKSRAPLHGVVFELENVAPANHVRLTIDDVEAEVEFANGAGTEILELAPLRAPRLLYDGDNTAYHLYRLVVSTRTGVSVPTVRRWPFHVGVALRFLGAAEPVDADLFHAAWAPWTGPTTLVADAELTIETEVTNRSRVSWPAHGSSPVHLSYRWLDAQGTVVGEGLRTELSQVVTPGAAITLQQRIRAPLAPGRYRLQRDLVRESVAWFSERRADSASTIELEVIAHEK